MTFVDEREQAVLAQQESFFLEPVRLSDEAEDERMTGAAPATTAKATATSPSTAARTPPPVWSAPPVLNLMAGGTYSVRLRKNGGRLYLQGAHGAALAMAVSGTVAASRAQVFLNRKPAVVLPLGASTLTATWQDTRGVTQQARIAIDVL
jgi:hypothetical protein